MSLGGAAGYAMWMRRYMVDELNKDYIKLARAKGMPNKDIMIRHVMRNAFVPMAQYLPSSVLLTISGSIYIESLYSCLLYTSGKPNTQFLPVRFAHLTVSIRNNRGWFWASAERSSTKEEVGHFQLGCDFKVEPHRFSCALHQLRCKYAR